MSPPPFDLPPFELPPDFICQLESVVQKMLDQGTESRPESPGAALDSSSPVRTTPSAEPTPTVTPGSVLAVPRRDSGSEDYLFSAMKISPAEAVAKIFEVCFPDARTALDASWGSGRFWSPKHPVPVRVIGLDKNPRRAQDVVGDYHALPFIDGAFDVGIGDPPFLSDGGRDSIMRRRYTADLDLDASEASVTQLCRELWRVSQLGVIIKVQDHIHANRLVQMSDWVKAAIPMPLYDELRVPNERRKVIDPKWRQPQLSFYRDHSIYLIFRKDTPVHKRRPFVSQIAVLEPERRCLMCDMPISDRRAGALTCSPKCRKALERRRANGTAP